MDIGLPSGDQEISARISTIAVLHEAEPAGRRWRHYERGGDRAGRDRRRSCYLSTWSDLYWLSR